MIIGHLRSSSRLITHSVFRILLGFVFIALFIPLQAMAASVMVTVSWPQYANENSVQVYDASNTTAITVVFNSSSATLAPSLSGTAQFTTPAAANSTTCNVTANAAMARSGSATLNSSSEIVGTLDATEADGIAFAFQRAPAGSAAVGSIGGGLGIGGLDPAIGIESVIDLGNIEDGAWHIAQVDWDPITKQLTYSLDGVTRAS